MQEKNVLAGAHKKFYRIQHPEIYLLDLKVQYKHKIKLPLDMVSKHVFLYLCTSLTNSHERILVNYSGVFIFFALNCISLSFIPYFVNQFNACIVKY